MTKSSQKKCQNCIRFFESTYPEMQRKPTVYLENMNINHEPVATRLISNINQIEFWLTFDIKHQPDRVLVDV